MRPSTLSAAVRRAVLPLALAAALLPANAPALPEGIARGAEEGLAQLYRLEFDAALATFEKLKKDFPDHPAPPALEAAAVWWESRYAFSLPSPAAGTAVERNVREAVRLGRKMAKQPGRECEGNLFIGGAMGVGAHWNLLLGNWFRAALDARQAVHTLRPLLSCSEFADEASFGLGMYEYAAAKLPWHMRWLSTFLIGGMNDRNRALERLARAAAGARFLRSDAQGMLAVTYTIYDTDPALALKYSSMLLRERPDSPMAAGLHLQALCFATRFEEALDAARKFAAGKGTFASETATFRYWEGIALLGLQRPAEAVQSFSAALAVPGRPPWHAASLLKRGCALDALGRREEALRDYRALAGLPDPWKEAKRAAIYLSRPFTWGDFPREISPRGI